MRILHLANDLVSTGNGISNNSVDLAYYQAKKGHEVNFISSGGGLVDLLSQNMIGHFSVNLRPRRFLTMIGDIPKLFSKIRDLRPEIVHVHTPLCLVLTLLFRFVHRKSSFGLIATVHNEWRVISVLMLFADVTIVMSQQGKSRYAALGFSKRKIAIVPHGTVNSPRQSDKEIEDTSDRLRNDLLIVTVAGLYKRKGIGDLIAAFALIAEEFPDALLKIAGWGPDERKFRKQIASLTCGNRIELLGFVSEPLRLLRQASVFVLASHTETFPLALAEAREAGCAIIAAAVGGVPELLEQGRAGLLVEPRNPAKLAEMLRLLLSNRAELEYWKQSALSNLEWLNCGRMADDTINVYRNLVVGN